MEKTGSTSKAKINALMRVLGVSFFQQAENKLLVAHGTISRIYHGQSRFSHRLFLRAAIVLDMKPSELMEKLGIDKDYFWDVSR